MTKKIVIFLLLCGFACSNVQAKHPANAEVRNLIFLIGDGMGLAHVSMLMIENRYDSVAFNRAQNVALMTTYSNNNRVTDSAAAGTALASGHKTNNGTLGQSPEGDPYESMMSKAEKQGMGTGIVVTSYLQHATPGAFYAHVAHRGNAEAISKNLLDSEIDVVIGGGKGLLPQECATGESYIEAFKEKGYNVVYNLAETTGIDHGKLLALVADKHLPDGKERGDYLPNATKKALEVLTNNATQSKKGFLLMVEGSSIDFAAHANKSEWLCDEMRDFDKTIAVAMDFADKNPGTLVVVAADHETGGLSIPSNKNDFTEAESGVRYAYSTTSHTGSMVPVYLYGTGAEAVNGIVDNTELARRLMKLLQLK
ncbi:MAG: alkaline phosphatase [Alistipes sp.]